MRWMGRTVTPGERMSISRNEMPRCFCASGSVRTRLKIQSPYCPYVVQVFCPLTTYSSPSRIAVVFSEARSEPAFGSEKPCDHQMSAFAVGGRKRSLSARLPNVAITGPTIAVLKTIGGGTCASVISSAQRWRCSGVQSWPPHSSGQCGTARPCALRMRCVVTMSSRVACSPRASRSRMSVGTSVVKNSRIRSANARSSLLKAKSMASRYLPVAPAGRAAAGCHDVPMDSKTLTDLISIPLFTGVIGYITNWTGVLMLFKPVQFHGVKVPGLRILFPYLPRRVRILPLIRYDGRIGWQGIVPSRADKMASISVDKGLAKLGSIGDFYRELEPDRIAEHLTAIAQSEIRDVVEQIMLRENPQLWRDLPPVIKEAVFARVRSQLPAIVRNLTDEIGENVDQLIDAKLMVISYFVKNPELLNELFLIMGRKELKFMQRFGAYFGVPAGVVLWGVLQLLPYWWVLPIGGVIIGWTVNWIGVTLIFEPVFPK